MCRQEQLRQVLDMAQSGLLGIFVDSLERILLFGSYARGDQDEESDIDVMALVNMPGDQLAGYRRRVNHLSSEIDLQHDVFLSITLQDSETFHRFAQTLPFFQNVSREGIPVG